MVFKNEYCEKCDKRYIDTDQWCKSCQINYLKKYFANWTSENEKINDFIQEMQLRINSKADIIFEWIPYNKFNSVKEISKSDSTTIYSAIWNDGLSSYDNDKMELIRESDEKVTLKLLHDSQNKTNEFLNEVKTYSVEGHANDDIPKIYGISQHPDTKDYIMVLQDGYCEKCGEQYKYIKDKWCKSCQINYFKKNFKSWTSGNENIDGLIQELQLKFDEYDHNIFEWISYDQFDNVTRLGGDAFVTIYSAIWNGGPLHYHEKRKEWIRKPGMKVALKCLHNSQNLAINELLDEINKYSLSGYDSVLQTYGISQNPDTKDYTLVLQDGYCEACGKEYIDGWCKPCLMNYLKDDFTNWTSGNEKIDVFIQEKQLKVDYFLDKIFEWIPYDQFHNIKKIGQGGFATVYSAIWKDGPLSYNTYLKMWLNEINTKVALKCLHDSKNVTDKFMKEVRDWIYKYSFKCFLVTPLCINRLKRIRWMRIVTFLKYTEYLNIRIQKIILWFLRMRRVEIFRIG
ncbi:hypothetical protein C1646_366117 [Rhizophagus diaphanus]|nr:hypothetical protein C1646_366117 [Rhizophagus diaphanus] [Rhizophagus sp. MUCL 43196]